MWVIFDDARIEEAKDRLNHGYIVKVSDPVARLSIDCAKLTKRTIDGWSSDIPKKYVDGSSPVYSKNGKEIFLIDDEEDKLEYKFLVRENGKEQKSASFSLARYSCFWYGRHG